MTNGWTGGQYSLFRAVLGAFLLARFGAVLAAEGLSTAGLLAALGILLAACFAAGWRDSWAAVCLIALDLGRSLLAKQGPLPDEPFVAGLLLLHVALPRAPYGSLDARGRVDPDGGWRMSPLVFGALWVAVAARYAFGGWLRLQDAEWTDGSALERLLTEQAASGSGAAELLLRLPSPLLGAATITVLGLHLGYPLFALFPRVRPWAWTLFLGLLLGWLADGGPARPPWGLFLAHLLCFDPRWIAPRRAPGPETLFYDGTCGLCHRFVRFVLAEDREGTAFRFAPLQGPLFEKTVPAAERADLPDSIVVQAADGSLRVRSDATVHALLALGGVWGVLGRLLHLVPRFARDAGYDLVAAYRKRFFPTPNDACPLTTPELQSRFVDR